MLLKERSSGKKTNLVARTRYMDTRFVTPTSNESEHLFSIARHSLTSRRKIVPRTTLKCNYF